MDVSNTTRQIFTRLARLGFGSHSFRGSADAATVDIETQQSVLRHYQRLHGLHVTGALDEATSRSIAAPRFCALPDVMAVEEVGASPPRWPAFDKLTYAFTNLAAWGQFKDLAVASFDWAWKGWMAVCGIQAQMTSDASKALVRIETAAIDGPSNVLAWSELADNTMNFKTQRFDSAEAWYEKFLRLTSQHETGHVLGLPHLANGNLMAPVLNLNINGPQAGDIAEVVARYGKPATQPPLPPDPPAPPVPPAGQTTITINLAGVINSIAVPGYRVTKLS